MLMGLGGLFQNDLVEWATSMTYQAASGAGAQNMRELIAQMGTIHASVKLTCSPIRLRPSSTSTARLPRPSVRTAFPKKNFRNTPLAGSLIPWIDVPVEGGQSKEEWKGGAECNKILGRPAFRTAGLDPDRRPVRAHRRHALPLAGADHQAEEGRAARRDQRHAGQGQPWVKVVPNDREISERELTPAAVTGTLTVPVGRLHKMAMGPEYLAAFTVRRPVAVGRGRAAAPHAAHPARGKSWQA
jgi:aspartate-semialdehyde dehydrogenase